MTSPADADPGIVKFSSNAFAERHRSEMFRDQLGRAVFGLEVDSLCDERFLLEFRALLLPGAVVGCHVVASVRSSRTSGLLADGNDDVQLMFVSAGRTEWRTRRGEFAVAAGGVFASAASETSSQATPGVTRGEVISLKRKMLAPLVGRLDDKCLRPLEAADGAVSLLKSYVNIIANLPASPPVAAQHLAVGHIYDLVALALGGTPDAVEAARVGGVRAARLSAVKADILRNLGNPAISAAWLARRQGVSESYIRRMFESEGASLSAFLLEARLRKAYDLLSDPRFRDRPISLVAFSVGFGDLSYFNRTFRRRFAATPSDVKTLAR